MLRLTLFTVLGAGFSLATVPDAVQVRWKEIGKTSVGNAVLVDPKSVKKDAAGIVTATLRVAFVKPVATPKGPITASRTVAMFDCQKQVVAVKENTYFHDEKKNTVFQRSAPVKPGFGVAIKGTLPDVAMGYLCKK
jgi:hypothetical protein